MIAITNVSPTQCSLENLYIINSKYLFKIRAHFYGCDDHLRSQFCSLIVSIVLTVMDTCIVLPYLVCIVSVIESSNVNYHSCISCLLLNNKPYIPLTVNNNTCISTCTTCIGCSTLHYIVFILHT